MTHNLTAVFQMSARDLIPRRHYPLFLAMVFLTSLYATYLLLPPINEMDWIRTEQQVRNMWRGINPYCDPYCTFLDFDPDLNVDEDYVSTQAYSPWVMFYFGVLAFAGVRVIVALSVAFWIIIVMDSGHPAALVLVIHPAFLMLWAAANADFVINGVGLWLILRGVRGWRRGVAWMLIAIKPQVLPFILLLEGARILWERDWEAIRVIAAIGAISVALYPDWLLETMPSYLNIARGEKPVVEVGLTEFPFSVYGAWGFGAALGVTVVILALMRHRLTEWRSLAVLLGLVWTPYINPYSYALLLILFRKTPGWRVGLYLAVSLAILPILFREFHQYERYGVLLFLLLAAALTTPDTEQTEEAIAARSGRPVFARPVINWLAHYSPASH
ncbi:MAG: hypothetical protein EHM39_00220 [Chloroflexi bacterium]|nr:MAG: hypothetical protein EHM39_00220 [Chloroflexota bacterium]